MKSLPEESLEGTVEQPFQFGCERCFGADPEAAWKAVREFTELARLIDESHFIVRIVSCPQCDQRYVMVFTELIDWKDGDDPQYRSVLPLTARESEQLMAQGGKVDLRLIESLGTSRRHLRTSWPKGGTQGIFWAEGCLSIGPHD